MSNSSELTRNDVPRARAFALNAHGDQRYGSLPYSVHLDAVAELLDPYGPTAQVIGYLHDVVEDTPVSLDTVRSEFGDVVARAVILVTDVAAPTRAERKLATNAKLAGASDDDRLALIVKAADRLANLRASAMSADDSKLTMYRAEHPAFREAAYRPGFCDDLWNAMGLILAERV